MILLLGDTHADFDFFKVVLPDLHREWQFEAIVQAGDFGVWPSYWKYLPRLKIPLYFVEGNHEDFHFLDYLRKGQEGVAKLKKNLYHVPRGATFTLGGRKWLGFGGCEMFSRENCPPGSVFTEAELKKALSQRETEILITHDGPYGLSIPGHPAFGGGIDVGSTRLQALYQLQPRLWLFAHHHRLVERQERGVKHFGLDCADQGYAILEPETLRVAWRGYH